MVQSNKYHKSRAVGVTSEVGLITDRDLAEPSGLRNTTSFIPLRYRKSRSTDHYATMWNSSIWPIDRTLSVATTPGQSGSGSDGNDEIIRIPQSTSITGASPSECLVLYPGHSWGVGGVLPIYRDAVGVFYNPSQLGRKQMEWVSIFHAWKCSYFQIYA